MIDENQKLTPLQQNVRAAFAGLVSADVMDASDHNYRCKCDKCLQWWLSVGPNDQPSPVSSGPFTQAEYEAAGGVVPEYVAEDNL